MNLESMFPKGSKSFFEANPQLAPEGEQMIREGKVGPGTILPPALRSTRTSKQPNKTEAEFGRILEAQKQRGEIIRYEYEGMTFRWSGMRYTPDWIVVYDACDEYSGLWGFKAIEVKGGHIFDRDIVRFKGARALWPEIDFEMWQKKAGQWSRIH
jgi:hypothetical protein